MSGTFLMWLTGVISFCCGAVIGAFLIYRAVQREKRRP